jgi:hypothetical protein
MADTDAGTGHNCGKNHLRDAVMHGDPAVTRRYSRHTALDKERIRVDL